MGRIAKIAGKLAAGKLAAGKLAAGLVAVLVSGAVEVLGQGVEIKGKVVDEWGEGVIGAAIVVSGTREGTTTNVDGEFVLKTKRGYPVELTVHYVGYKPQAVLVNEGKLVEVTLKESVHSLDEVVVTAGGIFRARREQGYATVKITDSELGAGKSPTLGGGLAAKIPGLQVNAISSGVNPNYRLVLRGNRSITGNNQALIVVDNAIVSNEFLNNINPSDIDNIQVLNGAAGSALYGSEASNGVLLITTKQGVKGKPQIKVSNTTSFESVSFFPKLQTRFGQGADVDSQVFDKVENQQFGPAFDGTIRELGRPLVNGDQQYAVYSPAKEGRNSFWETGVQNRTDVSVSFGNETISSFVSAQYLGGTGITPGDKYNKVSLRLNNTQKLPQGIELSYNVGYVENNYDITNNTNRIYSELTQISANVPVPNYKDWEHDKWSDVEGWYNPWYRNPYWTAANYREDTKDTYLTGKVDVKYQIKPWLHALYRVAIANRYYQTHQYGAKVTYSEYTRTVHTKADLPGYVYDRNYNKYRTNQDLQIGVNKDVGGGISVNLTLGASHIDNSSKSQLVAATGLVVPGLNHITNRSGDVTIPTEKAGVSTTMAAIPKDPNAIIRSRNYGLWGDLVLGYKNYVYLHVTGRNDWTSLLAASNRSYFYPSADVSLIVTDAVEDLKDNDVLDYLKVRGAWSRVGNVNIDPYSLSPVYSSEVGLSSGTFFRESKKLVLELKPEITSGYEAGAEFRLFKSLAEVQLTWYHTNTTGQAIEASIAPSSGYSELLLNAGEVTNDGIETTVRFNPLRTKDWTLHVGGNYTYNRNVLKKLYPGLPRLGVNGSTVIYAVEGEEINQIFVSDYARVPAVEADGTVNPSELVGKVIVDPLTGYPSKATESKLLGNTTPRHRLGLDFSLRYKQFTLSSVFEYRGGYYYAAHNIGSSLDFSGASARTAYYNRERFVFPNSVYKDTEGQYVANTNVTISDGGMGFWTNGTYNRGGAYSNYVYAGDYWKWREVSLTYEVPRSVVRKLTGNAVQEVSLSIQGRNLVLWTPASNEYTDPDYSANDDNATGVTSLDQTPPTRYVGGTISFTF
ncbi:MAG: SusC/RagA family TonB-linked outer membrane protein [Tannerellaceae bacterium]|jgi:TonB-linked SusC/RagA family outer membrane protein|nr:SusC/RagA family TonB-linked outer membrane protein [Tannerellaceae bacterium]